MGEEKLDWQISMKPANEKDKVLVEGYVTIPRRGEVKFTTIWTLEEFAVLVEHVGSLKEILAQIATGATKEKNEVPK